MTIARYLYLILSLGYLLAAESQAQNLSIIYENVRIDVKDVVIPHNSWVTPIPLPNHVWQYDWDHTLEYEKDIHAESPIRVDYTVQCEDGVMWNQWRNLYHESVPLCHNIANTNGYNIVNWVRQFLGIHRTCQVHAGEKRRPKTINFPLQNRTLLLRPEVGMHDIRVLVNVRSNVTGREETIFSAEFHPIYPVVARFHKLA